LRKKKELPLPLSASVHYHQSHSYPFFILVFANMIKGNIQKYSFFFLFIYIQKYLAIIITSKLLLFILISKIE
jgi:hypothetical protein